MGSEDEDERVDLPRMTEKQESVQKNDEDGGLKPLIRKKEMILVNEIDEQLNQPEMEQMMEV